MKINFPDNRAPERTGQPEKTHRKVLLRAIESPFVQLKLLRPPFTSVPFTLPHLPPKTTIHRVN